MNQRVKEKAETLGAILNDADIATMALPEDDDYESVIDTGDDVEALFAHLRGEDVPGLSCGVA